MLSSDRFHRIYRQSAIYDLALAAPFATPPTAWAAWWATDGLAQGLGLAALPPLDPHAMMFANFFGTIVTLWGLLRLRLDQPSLARWDAVGRVFFALAMAVALWRGANPLLWPLLVLELGWAALQLAPVSGKAWGDPGGAVSKASPM
jgi:hypothetical protein